MQQIGNYPIDFVLTKMHHLLTGRNKIFRCVISTSNVTCLQQTPIIKSIQHMTSLQLLKLFMK